MSADYTEFFDADGDMLTIRREDFGIIIARTGRRGGGGAAVIISTAQSHELADWLNAAGYGAAVRSQLSPVSTTFRLGADV